MLATISKVSLGFKMGKWLWFFMCVGSFQIVYPEPSMKAAVYCNYSDQIVAKYCTYMKKQHCLDCYGSGGGFMDNVNRIILAFDGVRNLSIAEARLLIVECEEELLKRINEDVAIRPYLSHYPFEGSATDISLCFYDPKGQIVESKYIGKVATIHGYIFYNIYDHEQDNFALLFKESYQEALKIVNQTKSLEQQPVPLKQELSVTKKKSKINAILNHIKNSFGM